jgi:ribonucleotide monophosphatase NagD (HAD superfamily)
MDLHRTSFSRQGFYLFVLTSSVICSAFKIRPFTRGVTSHIIHSTFTKIYNSQSGVGEASNVVSGMDSVSKFYDSFIIDQWGVLHDGKTPYTGVTECLQKLKDDGKNLILLSNSSKRKANSVKGLDKVGIKSILFDEIVTSGELAWNAIMDRNFDFKISPPSATSVGQQGSDMTVTSDDSKRTLKVFVIGNNDDDTEYIRSCGCVLSPPESADFILARGTFCILSGSNVSGAVLTSSSNKASAPSSTKEPSSSGPTEPSLDGSIAFSNAEDLIANIDPYLQRCIARGLPMLVSNPDFTRPGSGAPMPGQIGTLCYALIEAVVMLCCCVVWCGVVWCGVVWCGVVWCGVVWCGVVWCVKLCYVMLCYVMLCYVLACHVMFFVC